MNTSAHGRNNKRALPAREMSTGPGSHILAGMSKKKSDPVFDSVKNFIERFFIPASDFSDADLQLSTHEILQRVIMHFGELTVGDLHALMQEMKFIDANMPGKDMRPVWLLKVRE